MAITSAICNTYKVERQKALHDLTTHTLKLALIKVSPTGTYGAGTTNYSDLTGNSDEVTGAGYSAGGKTLTNVTVTLDGDTAVLDFDDPAWTGATFTTRGALLYNASAGNRAIAVWDFGATESVTAGTFTLIVPLALASLAIMRSV